ncbi:hypothetical protein PFISCL1PPCAC_5840, partial [Pristionchus fissidentatus]
VPDRGIRYTKLSKRATKLRYSVHRRKVAYSQREEDDFCFHQVVRSQWRYPGRARTGPRPVRSTLSELARRNRRS